MFPKFGSSGLVSQESLYLKSLPVLYGGSVKRDRLMMEQAKQYPQYSFEKHKGYLTKVHLEALKAYGPIEGFHRISYKPVKDSIKQI